MEVNLGKSKAGEGGIGEAVGAGPGVRVEIATPGVWVEGTVGTAVSVGDSIDGLILAGAALVKGVIVGVGEQAANPVRSRHQSADRVLIASFFMGHPGRELSGFVQCEGDSGEIQTGCQDKL